ncbi:hypothetical protein YC2023_102535 [Brassica napus]
MGSEVHGKRAFLIGLVLLLIDEHAYVEEPKMRPNKELVKLRTSKKTKKRAYKFFVLCIVGTNTKDRVKFRIHKQVTDLFSALDVVKQITSITIEPGIEDKFNTSES